MRKSDFTKVGAKETKRMAEMPMDGYVIVAGGDTMVANIQFLYLDNIESKIQLLFERFIRKILGGNYVQLVKNEPKLIIVTHTILTIQIPFIMRLVVVG